MYIGLQLLKIFSVVESMIHRRDRWHQVGLQMLETK